MKALPGFLQSSKVAPRVSRSRFTFVLTLTTVLLISPWRAQAQSTVHGESTSLIADVPDTPGTGFPHSPGGASPTASAGIFSRIGFDAHGGLGGLGFDVATSLSRRFNVRLGGDFFSYTDTFVEEEADVNARLQLRSGHVNVDWFPFANSFRISPMLVFANNNNVRGTVIVPPGTTITIGGDDYVSSATDPLHGSGSVDFRKVSPGLTLGFGNIVAPVGKHFSFPVELGFYYVGQPRLNVAFTGSACDPTVSPDIGCESVDQDPDFQQSLTEFRARNNNNLSYASFFPVFTAGIGYRF